MAELSGGVQVAATAAGGDADSVGLMPPSREVFDAKIKAMLADAKTKAVSYMTEEKYNDVVNVLKMGKGVPSRKLTYQWLKRYRLDGDELRTIEFVQDDNGMRRSVIGSRMVHLGQAFDVLSEIHAEIGDKSILGFQNAVKRRRLTGLPASVLERFRQSCPGCLGVKRRSSQRKPKAGSVGRLCCAGLTVRVYSMVAEDSTSLPGSTFRVLLVCADSRSGLLLSATAIPDASAEVVAFHVAQACGAFCPPLHINSSESKEWRTAFANRLKEIYPASALCVTGSHSGGDGLGAVACGRLVQALQAPGVQGGWAIQAARLVDELNREELVASGRKTSPFERAFRSRSAKDTGVELQACGVDLAALQVDTPEELAAIVNSGGQDKLAQRTLKDIVGAILGVPDDDEVDAAATVEPEVTVEGLSAGISQGYSAESMSQLADQEPFEKGPVRKKPRVEAANQRPV